MAKCIRYFRPYGGHVARVSDDEAAAEVRFRRAMFCPKHWLKAARAAEADEADEADEACIKGMGDDASTREVDVRQSRL